MRAVGGVSGIHHVHLWKLPDGRLALSAHIELAEMVAWPAVLKRLQAVLDGQGIGHSTLQPEIQATATFIARPGDLSDHSH